MCAGGYIRNVTFANATMGPGYIGVALTANDQYKDQVRMAAGVVTLHGDQAQQVNAV